MSNTATTQEKLALLREPFSAKDIEWKVGTLSKDKTRGVPVPYLRMQAVVDRLDAVIGAQHWKNEFRAGPSGGVVCALSLRLDNEWLTKENGAGNTQVEGIKGGMSDALKRAAMMWGVGRYLYAYKSDFVGLIGEGRLAYEPTLPDDMLPADERGQNRAPEALSQSDETVEGTGEVPALPAPAPADEAAAGVAQADAVAQAPAETLAVVDSNAVAEQPAAAAPAVTEPEPAAQAAAAEAPAAAGASTENVPAEPARPEGLTDAEDKRIVGLFDRLVNKNVDPELITGYAKDREKSGLSEAAVAYVTAYVEWHKAKKASAAE